MFRSARDSIPRQVCLGTWEDLVRLVGRHRLCADKLGAEAISPAEWPPGATRSKATVRCVHFAAFDFDKITQEAMDAVLRAMDGLDVIYYTTWSHAQRHAQNGSWSFRLFLRLDRPVLREEWPDFFPRMRAAAGGTCDPRCKDPSRMYFLPSSPDGDGIVEAARGVAVSVDMLLAQGLPDPGPQDRVCRVGALDLDALAARLARRQSPHAKAVAAAVRQALAGQPVSPPGNVDNMLFQVACAVAEEWPDVDPESAAIPFEAALRAASLAAPDGQVFDVRALAEKIGRQQDRMAEERARLEAQRRQDAARRISDAFGGLRTEPYDEDELAGFAAAAGTDLDGLRRRWIVQVGGAYHIFKGGSYGQPLAAEELVAAAERDLAAASSAGVTVWAVTQTGRLRPKAPQELVLEYGAVADRTVVDLAAQRSCFDGSTRTLVEAPCPVRPLDPRRSDDCASWLEAFAGTQLDVLLDWLAAATELSHPCVALYLDGPPSTGKTLFAEALSRLWTLDGPTPLDDVAGPFNEGVIRCPLVFADEVMPEILRRTEGTGSLRYLIQARHMPLRRKYRAPAGMRGCVRLILAANNRHLLDSREPLTPEDVDAVGKRIRYFHVPSPARDILDAMGPVRVRTIAEDGLAGHALWLRQVRKIDRGERFLVPGADSALHRALATGRGLTSAACHWCVSYLLQPGKMDIQGRLLVRIREGRLLVTARALAEHWEMYATNVQAPASGRIARALSAISDAAKVRLAAGDGRQTKYWRIKTESLLTWADDMSYATGEEILRALETDTVEPASGPAGGPNENR